MKNNRIHPLLSEKKIHITLYSLALLAFVAILYGFFLFHPWNVVVLSEGVDITIERGMTPQGIADVLEERGVIPNGKQFIVGAKLLRASRRLQAGRYYFEGRLSNFRVIHRLVRGRVIAEWITFPEGTRASRMAGIASQTFKADSVQFMAWVGDTAFCCSLGIEASSLEGYLYPDTYRFHSNPTPKEIIARMVDRFRDVFSDSLRERAAALGLTVQDVVTLASIVEGEAALDSERTTISALYHNRLRRGMRLQADPTIQYIIQDGPRRLLNRDLEIDSPYNTYMHSGLPPGPVNNPGIASIVATLYPADVDFLYMVANGDGSHTFSRTIREHLEAKERFDRLRRQVRRRR